MLSFVIPSPASAAIVRGTHHGRGTAVFAAMTHVVALSYGIACADADACTGSLLPLSVSLTDADIGYVCSMQRALPYDAPDALTEWIGRTMARIMGRHAEQVMPALKDSSFCESHASRSPRKKVPAVVHLTKNGVVVSTNPVWNACVTSERLTRDLIRSNRDIIVVHRGNISKKIPLTCRDYHRGDVHLWQHPDFPELEIQLDEKGRLLGGVPAGFVVRTDVKKK